MKLSIVIPCKNEEDLLPKLLASIKKQTFTDYEVIVADAHSTDRTCEIAKSYGARVVEGGMPGPGRNRGALNAKGDLLLFLDADVVLASNRYLEDALKEFDAKKADVATCQIHPISDKIIDRALHGAYNAYAKLTEEVLPHAAGMCILVRRHTHEGLKGFNEQVVLAEDMDYVRRAAKEGHRFKVLTSHPIEASVRRLDKEGRWGLVFKYVFGELQMLLTGPITKLPFEYEMGGKKRNDQSPNSNDQ